MPVPLCSAGRAKVTACSGHMKELHNIENHASPAFNYGRLPNKWVELYLKASFPIANYSLVPCLLAVKQMLPHVGRKMRRSVLKQNPAGSKGGWRSQQSPWLLCCFGPWASCQQGFLVLPQKQGGDHHQRRLPIHLASSRTCSRGKGPVWKKIIDNF